MFNFVCFAVQAQVRLIQLSDAHSSLKTISDQLKAIDFLAQDFLLKNPKGEVVIYILGDFTSINSYSRADGGWLSYKALKILKDKGYTVLFTPGNHDAFDWSISVSGAELFIQQMAKLNEWGIPILSANMHKPTSLLKGYLSESYPLRTIKKSTHIVGLTLDRFLPKSNLPRGNVPQLFETVLGYEETMTNLVTDLRSQNVQQIIAGIHQGHKGLRKLAEFTHKNDLKEVSLYMGGDDHKVAAYTQNDIMIADAGAYGSFNVIDIARNGNIIEPVRHVSIDQSHLSLIKPEVFEGEVILNQDLIADLPEDEELYAYRKEVQAHIDVINLGNRNLIFIEGFETHKMHMKIGRTELGSLIAESLGLWARDILSVDDLHGLGPINYIGPIVSMMHSGSYRVEVPIPEGVLTEFMIDDMYPYENLATIYKLTGKKINELYQLLRKTYAASDPDLYSPQISFNFRENNGELEYLSNGKWIKLKKNMIYPLALDGWLSNHRLGLGLEISSWIKALTQNEPISTRPYQDVLIEYLPKAIANHRNQKPPNLKYHIEVQGMCEAFMR